MEKVKEEKVRPMRLCILGPSGIGKSVLSYLFKLKSWEPKRIREPRNKADEAVCMPPEKFANLVNEYKKIYKKQGALFEFPRQSHRRSEEVPEKDLYIFEKCSFLKVRGANQYLEHIDEAKRNESLRIEIFAPLFVQMFQNREKIKNAFVLTPENIVVLLLNPTFDSYRDMRKPSTQLLSATLVSTIERSRLQKKGVDLADSLARIERLPEELDAWREMFKILPVNIIECKKWSHFEFRYSVPGNTLCNARNELIRARESVLLAIEKAERIDEGFKEAVKKIMRTPAEIVELSDIV